jgi:hypothetical protein
MKIFILVLTLLFNGFVLADDKKENKTMQDVKKECVKYKDLPNDMQLARCKEINKK